MPERNLSKYVAAAFAAPRITLILVVLALCLLGLVTVFTSSYTEALNLRQAALDIIAAGGEPNGYEDIGVTFFLEKQAFFAVVGIVVAVIMFLIPPHWWRGWLPFVAVGIAYLCIFATQVMGVEILGAKRALSFAGMQVQTTEFCKIAYVVMLSKVFMDMQEGRGSGWIWVAEIALGVALPLGLTFIFQSDLGSSMIICVGLLAVLWTSGYKKRIAVILVICAIVFVLVNSLSGDSYRSDRWIYADPWNDGEAGRGTGFQNIRSYYALAGGGLLGVGLGNSHEKFDWLPEAETDFAFAVLCEELGLVGAGVVIALFFLLLVSGLWIARSCSSPFGRMAASGLICMLVFQAYLNMGCVVGLLPTTGKPLPFFSYGGASLVATFMLIGVIFSVTKDSSEPQRRRDDLRVVRSTSSHRSLSPDDFHAVGTGGRGASRRSSGDRSLRGTGGGARGSGRNVGRPYGRGR
ncbi:MAG: FtsW/RodA/SpoVE family cell cycle protein [Coriobacteriia bacterium]|nr:FtsW/RodA/SpoVE family cell cycle protein [Coriobacteriia bacterium]